MRRIQVHAVFGVVALVCATAVALQAWRLQQTQALNAAIAEAARSPVDPAAATLPSPDAPPEARLARAAALARAGAHDAASKTYVGLIRPGDVDAIGRDALFNLGNLYLRQGLAQGGGGTPGGEALPLVELAKQRYRDLLRASPGDWDARYNLERALRLAPEEQEAVAEAVNEPVERRRVMLRGMDPGDLP